MRTILYIVQKEFLQIGRDKFLRTAIITVPIIQMMVLVYAANFELQHVQIHFVDQDKSMASSELIHKFSASPFFITEDYSDDVKSAKENLQKDIVSVVCVIPEGFSNKLSSRETPDLQLLINSINGSTAQLALGYCQAVISDYMEETAMGGGISFASAETITIKTRHWYNPGLDYKIFMAPGILVILVTIIGWMLTGMNLVREKEAGTIEQLNVTPIQKYQFIAGKLIPFLLIGLFDLAFGLGIARLLFHVPVEGSLLTLFAFGAIYLIAVLGIGLFISTVSNTQQQVLFVSFFFVMIFVLMSGLFTAVENMPEWGQKLNLINPMAYFIKVIRMILLKGSSFMDIRHEFISIFIFAVFTNSMAVWRYRKTI